MTVANTNRVNKRIAKLMSDEMRNSQIAGAFDCFNTGDVIYTDYIKVNEQAAKFKELMAKNNVKYTDDEALVGWMLSDIVLHKGIPVADKAMQAIIRSSKVFRRGEIEANPYLQNVKPGIHAIGRFATDETSIAKYEVMGYTEAAIVDNMLIPMLGVFDHKFTYPYIKENGRVWMSITPNEIFTMEEAVEKAHGNILTLGLGIGYYAYMAHIKDDVERVTVVERDENVIELFKRFILPQFDHPEKIVIVRSDAFEYMKNLDDGVFDYCFADLWKGGDDLEPYIECKKVCRRFEKMPVDYWINNGMAIMFMSCIKAYILGEYFKNTNNTTWQAGDPPECMKQYADNIHIKTSEDVDFYTDIANIDEIIARIV